jgi:outer membrane lipoprotein-sorting protein
MNKNMKRLFFVLFASMALVFGASAQTAEEIVARMDKETEKGDTQGLAMTMSMKIPIVGEFSTRIKARGDYSKAESTVKGEKVIFLSDNKTTWTYTANNNELVIEPSKGSQNDEGELVKGITSGYDVSIKGETADAWQIKCVKQKSNQDKDDPKTMDLVVSKKTYLPVRLVAKVKMVTVTLSNFALGVSPEEVKFDQSAYKDAKVIDKR